MKYRTIFTLCLSILFSSLLSGAEPSGSRPNIVFIMSDDMGWAQPGYNGGKKELTPNMDALAAEGMKLSSFYTHSVCAPTRSAFLTGRYSFRTWTDWRTEDFGKPSFLEKLGLTLPKTKDGVETRRIHALASEERTIAEALKEAGYTTSLVGKWHLGEWLPEHLPMGQGFDHQYGHYGWGIGYYNKMIVHNAPARFAVYDWHRNQSPIEEEGYATELFADEAVRVIGEQKKDQPFFMYVAFNAVHGPLDVPRGKEDMDPREAMLESLDQGIGKIVKAIDKNGFRDNTLLVLTNDNGPVLEEMSHPYRGTKNTTFEGGVRQPCILRWPGQTEAGATNDGMMFITDFYSTFINLAGGSHEQEKKVDAFDMTKMLFAGAESPREEIVYDVKGSVRLPTIRSGNYKLMGDALYDIVNDPAEQNDIAKANPDLVKTLKERVDSVGNERPPLGDKPLLMEPPLPYVYGQAENENPPEWLVKAVDAMRETQPKEWAPGETPWPKAPKGANASKMDGLADEK